jgi:8-oxo-dGTP diphosphatase
VRRPGPPADEATVRAAGGVIVRTVADVDGVDGVGVDRVGVHEVVVVHRPRYDDWSLPKGKLDKGESFEDAAVREAEEETGLVVALGAELPLVTYFDRFDRPKVVRYWVMTVVRATPFVPNDEVDEVAWMPPAEARARCTYDTDRDVLDAFVALDPT